ncbi:hypothetical protein [Halorhabdus sp. CUG00001]|uniref:hypothetical protein n=1 Tax=Halorhabdus sp. CUG00001 TaxID=2600297 RepID=UPI00131AEEC8|nr:hypothetical protein [Halorhabdus sp. CUG00001]
MTTDSTGESNGTDGEAERATDSDAADDPGRAVTDDRAGKIVEYLELGAVAVLALLSIIAVFGAYTSAMGAIDTWVAREYESIFRAVFNLVVLGLVAIGLSVLVRRRFES